jgi:hypothetical protein
MPKVALVYAFQLVMPRVQKMQETILTTNGIKQVALVNALQLAILPVQRIQET